MTSASALSARDAALERARRQVREVRAFYLHGCAYAAVIGALWVLDAATGPPWWAQWPTLGWGLGVAVHGLSVFAGDSFFGPAWEERKVAEAMARERLRVVTGEKARVIAQLRLLQAQIEPHFLFNTLANVQSLIARQPREAEAMLDHFVGYLRKSLQASRAERGTLAQEFELLRHYLELLRIRMGARLAFELLLPDELASQPLAPMLLQPLVENAIRHGLEPKVEGGTLRVQAHREADRLVVDVVDDGLGFGAHPDSAGTGMGLAHTRERLAVLYDGRASLVVADAEPGTRVTLTMPYTPDA